MAGRNGLDGRLAIERLEILYGLRGNPRDWALRRGELVDVQRIIAEVRKALDDLTRSLEKVKEDIDELNAAVGDLEQELASVQDRLDDAEQALTALEAAIAGIEGQLTAIDTNIANLQADVASLQAGVTGITTDVAYLQNAVTNLQTDVGELDAQVADLQSDVNGLELDVDALQENAASRFALQSNPGANPFDPGFEAIPLYTSGELTGGITITSNTIFTVPIAGLYMFEVEVRVNGGAPSHPPVGTPFALSIDTTTLPTTPRAGYSVSDVARAMTITRLVCVERLAASAQRVAYFLNEGVAAYQVASAVVKITRISA